MIKITATEGKIFRRISDGMLFGNEIYLGLAYQKDAEPYEELPEHFEEVDIPLNDEDVIIDDDTPLADEETELPEDDELPPEETERKTVTLADYRELERKVELLMQMTGGMI